MIYKFFDTSSLLLVDKSAFLQEDYKIIISTITLQELEDLKDKKYEARKCLRLLDKYQDKYDVYIFDMSMLKPIIEKNFGISNDMKILAAAINYDKKVHPDETVFVTNDRALKHIANIFFGEDSIESIQ